jgi:hypothetical protein
MKVELQRGEKEFLVRLTLQGDVKREDGGNNAKKSCFRGQTLNTHKYNFQKHGKRV